MGSCGIVPVHKGVEEPASMVSGRESSTTSSKTFSHDGLDDPLGLAVRVRMVWLRESLLNPVAPQSCHERVVLSAPILRSIVGIRLLHGKRHRVERFFEEDSRGIAGLVREDVGHEEA